MIGVTWMHKKRMDNKRMDNKKMHKKRMDNKTANAQEIMCMHSTNTLQHTATHCKILQHAATHTATRTAQYHVDAQQDSACTARQCIHDVCCNVLQCVAACCSSKTVHAQQGSAYIMCLLYQRVFESTMFWRHNESALQSGCTLRQWMSEVQAVWVTQWSHTPGRVSGIVKPHCNLCCADM